MSSSSNHFSEDQALLIEEYDLFNQIYPFAEQLQTGIAEALIAQLKNQNIQGDIRLVECGTGTGETLFALTDILSQTFPDTKIHITTLDPSKIMLDIARKTEEQKDYRNITIEYIEKGLTERLREENRGTIHGLFSGFTLHNFPKPQRTELFTEIAKHDILSIVLGDKIQDPDLQTHKKHLDLAIQRCDLFITKYNRPDLKEERIEHYLRDDKEELRLTQEELTDLFLLGGCVSPIYGERFEMEQIVLSLKKK